MKVFVTGGTGYIGSAVALRLKKAGHDVQALVRNKEKGSALQGAGVKLVQGDLANPAGYSAAAYGAQAVVHCASDTGAQAVELDRKSIQTARELLHGRHHGVRRSRWAGIDQQRSLAADGQRDVRTRADEHVDVAAHR